MATFIVIDRIISILTILILCGFTAKMYVELTEPLIKRKLECIITLGLIVGFVSFVYTLGRLLILWLY